MKSIIIIEIVNMLAPPLFREPIKSFPMDAVGGPLNMSGSKKGC